MFYKEEYQNIKYLCSQCFNSANLVMDMGSVYLDCLWCHWSEIREDYVL